MNSKLFANNPNAADTTNAAGGRAYALSHQMALLQYAVTGTFNDTFYTGAEAQLNDVLKFAQACDSQWIARVAIYARQYGFMKDAPAFLVAFLSTRPEKELFNFTFDAVIDNVGMARTFVQMMRSGVVGRKSLGSTPKKAVARLLNTLSGDKVFFQCAGTSPSIEDVLRLTHAKPRDAEHDALFGYLLGKDYLWENLPSTVKAFEDYKSGRSTEVPHVDFRRLTALQLTTEQWRAIGRQMTWNQLRLNLNTLARHDAFDTEFTQYVATRLRDVEAIKRQKVLPFAVYNALSNLDAKVPPSVRSALGFCLDQSLYNAPELTEPTLILTDSSGSMTTAITGNRGSATSSLQCVGAAAMFAASLLKRNPDNVTVIPFDTVLHPVKLNPRDSLESITRDLTRNGGGTDCSCGIRWALHSAKWKNILIISDNESWYDGVRGGGSYSYYHQPKATAMANVWAEYRRKVPNAKLICWDLSPNATIQAKNDASVLNIGGFTESAYELVRDWYNNSDRDLFFQRVNAIPLR